MRNARRRLYGAAWFAFVLVLVAGMFTLAYFLTGLLYDALNLKPPLLLAEFVNSVLGLVFTGSIVGLVGKLARARGWMPEANVFARVIEAMERIAAGDFSVRLENQFEDNPMVGELTKSVNKMAVELHQWESMRQEFISNVSHEIQSPLTSIRGFAQALENDRLSAEERHHYLDVIQSESTRLSRITEELLKLAALESEKAPFEPRPYRLDRQIRDLVLASEPQWAGKGLDLEVDLDELEITADEDLLSQVWINLLHNAVKFTSQGGKISLYLHRNADQAEFRINDTGAGISEEDQDRIFERFYKADKSRTHSGGGSGLGLSIVKKIVEMHRGTVEVESLPGQGTTFRVHLPLGGAEDFKPLH